MSNTDFNIPRDGYLTFDANTMKQFIKDRLNETKIFTDQNYEGSYISTVNEIIAYTFNVLMYYLNRTSTESMYSESQIYENMSRIVKLIDYKPIGKQTSTLSFLMSAGADVDIGMYTIPRYSYIENGDKTFSFNEDVTFSKDVSGVQSLDDVSDQKLLYQGRFREYPKYAAIGNENEVIFLTPGENVIVDHFNIDVYVKNADGFWRQWNEVPTLYLENATSESFELRLNESKHYEIKFGNGINGKKLEKTDTVAIYYLESNGSAGEVGAHAIQNNNMNPYSSLLFNEIMSDINAENEQNYNFITPTEAQALVFDNTSISTYFQDAEGVDSIRTNAPGIFRSQYRLVTEQDYTNFIKVNFANIIHDVSVSNNWKFLSEQMKYYYDIGLASPNNISNVLYNQLHFADGCNFNNVYITVVPKTISDTKNPTTSLSASQKELILSTLKGVKTLTSEPIIIDPVYVAADICLKSSDLDAVSLSDVDNTEIYIEADTNVKRDPNLIISDVYDIFNTYFQRGNVMLGDKLDITALTNSILSVKGVKTFYTRRTDDTSISYAGLSMLIWNPIYQNDMTLVTKNTATAPFKYLFLNNKENFNGKISVSTNTKRYQNIEF